MIAAFVPPIPASRESYIWRLAMGDILWTSATDEERSEAEAIRARMQSEADAFELQEAHSK